MTKEIDDPEKIDKRGLQESYFVFSKILSIWLVTYGVALLAFMASNDTVVGIIKNDLESAKCIFLLVLAGLGIQVGTTFFYKFILAYLSHGELKKEFRETRLYKFCNCAYYCYSFEIFADLVTLIFYFCATYMLFDLVFCLST